MMTAAQWKDMTPIVKFIEERQRIYKKKAAKRPWPWTTDKALQRAKINNVFRRLDKFSQYEWSVIKQLSPAQQVHFIVIARYVFSQPLMEFLRSRNYRVTEQDLLAFKASVGGGFSYINEVVQFYRPAKSCTETLILTHLETAMRSAETFVTLLHERAKTPTEACAFIAETFPQLGPFRVYEVYTSLTYTKWFPFSENDLLVIGPGSAKMAQRFGIQTLEDFQACAAKIQAHLKKKNLHCPYPFTVRAMEDSLCEFRKYTRAQTEVVKLYKPDWFPVLVGNRRYIGPPYIGGKVFKAQTRTLTPVMKFAKVFLRPKLVAVIDAMTHGRLYTRPELTALAATVDCTHANLSANVPVLVQLGFLQQIK